MMLSNNVLTLEGKRLVLNSGTAVTTPISEEAAEADRSGISRYLN